MKATGHLSALGVVITCKQPIARLQSIIFLYLYFIVATFTVFFLWSLAGFAFVGNKAFDETCKMMDLHAQGYQNEYVLDNLPCDDLATAGAAVREAQLAANTEVEEGNTSIERTIAALLFVKSCLIEGSAVDVSMSVDTLSTLRYVMQS